jgi:hypothetical protein
MFEFERDFCHLILFLITVFQKLVIITIIIVWLCSYFVSLSLSLGISSAPASIIRLKLVTLSVTRSFRVGTSVDPLSLVA